jgi:hypothetical protein
MAQYNADAVQSAIDRDKTISAKEAKAIHALLKGRTKPDAVIVGRKAAGSVNDFHRCPQCRMGSSYPVPLREGASIQCPHCEYIRPHKCHI